MPDASDAKTIAFSLDGYRALMERAAGLGYAAGPVCEVQRCGVA